MTARVTWLMPVLNAMPYLPETLRSIEEQTYRDAETLAWDNGSTDGSLEELHRWIPRRIPGRVVSGRPSGVGGSLRQAILETESPLCARIDADDVNVPERLQLQVDFLDAHPEVAILGTQMSQINAAGETINESAVPFPGSHEKILLSLLCRNPFCHPTMMFRKQAIIDAGNYRDVSNVEDYDLWFRLAHKGYRFHNLAGYLVQHRVHDMSITQRSLQSGRQRALVDACVLENAPGLYGCSTETVRKLRGRAYAVGAIPVAGLVWDFARAYDQNLFELVADPAIAFGWHYLIQPTDYVSRVLFKAASLLARAASR